jgi:hypothetical protein
MKVLCVAPEAAALSELKRAAAGADWELTAGATTEAEALRQLDSEHPHVVVVFGDFASLVRAMRERRPFTRILTDRPADVETVIVADGTDLRAAIMGLPRPGGPVT